MSYIHEALKKAQKDRDGYSRSYNGTLSVLGKENRPVINRKVLLGSLILLCLFIAYASYSRLGYKTPQTAPVSTYEKRAPKSSIERKSVRDAGEFYDKARVDHKHGRLEEAKRLYRETIIIEPGHIDAINNLAVIYIHEKDYERAIRGFEKAIRLGPGYVDPYYNLACVYALKGKLSESLAHLKKAAMIDKSVMGWARTDPDLKNIREIPEFDAIMKAGVRR